MTQLFKKFESLATRHAAVVASLGTDPFGVEVDHVLSATEAVINGQTKLHLGSNNYLGLSFDDEAIEASCQATQSQGVGTTGSRAANGGFAAHRLLEREIARFYNRRKAMLFTTGYQGNVGFLGTIAGKDDVILIDADSHASIYDACKLGDATVLHFKHNDPKDLERRLRRLPADRNTLVVTEGLFSMLGDRAPLADLVAVAKKYDAAVAVDEAHSMGVLGAHGRGLAEAAGVEDEVDFILGTFSKSAGAIGGFCVSNHEQLDSLRLAARAYLFTASLPPSVVASVTANLRRIRRAPELMARLWENAHFLYSGLQSLDLPLGPEPGPVIAIRMPDIETGLASWKALLDAGIYINLAALPAVPGGGCLLRCSVNAAHSRQQLEHALNVFRECLTATGLIVSAKNAAG